MPISHHTPASTASATAPTAAVASPSIEEWAGSIKQLAAALRHALAVLTDEQLDRLASDIRCDWKVAAMGCFLAGFVCAGEVAVETEEEGREDDLS